MDDFLLYEQHEGIVTLTMNRPQERNALTEEHQMLEFATVCARMRRDPTVKVVILTGAGSAFSAGGNLKNMRDKKGFSAGSPADIRDSYRNGIQQIPLALYELDIPTIAMVNGPAIGAGMDLTCMCDLRVASDQATFASSFVKLGIVPADGGAWLLSRTIGQTKALELMFTGETIDAHRALAIGLVTMVAPHEQLREKALDLAQRIAANPSRTVRLTKRLLRESDHSSLASSLELAAAYQALAHNTSDHDEAVRAFLEKRPPVFTGR
ncbi:crotonase/enoyl-CoA hydratase family protein [Ramlibacter sp. PS3R-8]|uniref:crotonase/enoyl-CoA hydratase family protein n=1 Tax=Ramlibacter sp. PS3R-8 TaxID=3133437 RepID=UPI0030AD490D